MSLRRRLRHKRRSPWMFVGFCLLLAGAWAAAAVGWLLLSYALWVVCAVLAFAMVSGARYYDTDEARARQDAIDWDGEVVAAKKALDERRRGNLPPSTGDVPDVRPWRDRRRAAFHDWPDDKTISPSE